MNTLKQKLKKLRTKLIGLDSHYIIEKATNIEQEQKMILEKLEYMAMLQKFGGNVIAVYFDEMNAHHIGLGI